MFGTYSGHTLLSGLERSDRAEHKKCSFPATTRRRNRTFQAPGYDALPVLKTGWATRPLPRRHGSYEAALPPSRLRPLRRVTSAVRHRPSGSEPSAGLATRRPACASRWKRGRRRGRRTTTAGRVGRAWPAAARSRSSRRASLVPCSVWIHVASMFGGSRAFAPRQGDTRHGGPPRLRHMTHSRLATPAGRSGPG